MALTDLDDLINACRNPKSKQTLAEAVACYKVGAYRACIVTTWIAVTFDYLGKLQDLEVDGNKAAAKLAAQFEKARQDSDKDASLRLERELIDTASTEFELLTPLECIDMQRLYEDRNRCAHPSLLSAEVPYQPSAELARSHLKHAVEHMLSQRPVQGKAARARIWGRITSQLFPEDDRATLVLKEELGRARPTLIRWVVVELAKALIADEGTDVLAERRFIAAFKAMLSLYRSDTGKVLAEKLPGILGACDDGRLPYAVVFLNLVPEAWDWIGGAEQQRLLSLIQSKNDAVLLVGALKMHHTRPTALGRLADLPMDIVEVILSEGPDPEVAEGVVVRFQSTRDWAELKHFEAIFGLESRFSKEQRQRLVEGFLSNKELRGFGAFTRLARALLRVTGEAQCEKAWREIGEAFPHLNEAIQGVFGASSVEPNK